MNEGVRARVEGMLSAAQKINSSTECFDDEIFLADNIELDSWKMLVANFSKECDELFGEIKKKIKNLSSFVIAE